MILIIDTSGWIEYFTGGTLQDKFKSHIEGTGPLLVPTIVLYEVYKKIKLVAGEEEALKAIGTLKMVVTSDDHFKDLPNVVYFSKDNV